MKSKLMVYQGLCPDEEVQLPPDERLQDNVD